ncbi:MAG: metallophosphoesterase family protein [Blautia sp.]|nr:metallophosphoesterase family protein [Blautia sp.]
MKKIGIISDTHGLLRPEILEILKSCDCIIHAGDINREEILDQIRWIGNLYVVRGNNDKDWANNLSQTLRFVIEGIQFVLVHNKKDIGRYLEGTQVVVFGHTHKYHEEVKEGRLWLNPGSCGPRRFNQEITMAVMMVEGGCYKVEKITIPGLASAESGRRLED